MSSLLFSVAGVCGSSAYSAVPAACDAALPSAGMTTVAAVVAAATVAQAGLAVWTPALVAQLSQFGPTQFVFDHVVNRNAISSAAKVIAENRDLPVNFQQGRGHEAGHFQLATGEGRSELDLNIFTPGQNFPAIDTSNAAHFVSLKAFGIDGPLTNAILGRYDRVLRNLINAPDSSSRLANRFAQKTLQMINSAIGQSNFRLAGNLAATCREMLASAQFPNPVRGAADLLHQNAGTIAEGGNWPASLPVDADVEEIMTNLQSSSVVGIPPDHVSAVQDWIEWRIREKGKFAEYGFTSQPTEAQLVALKNRIVPAGLPSTHLNILLTMFGKG